MVGIRNSSKEYPPSTFININADQSVNKGNITVTNETDEPGIMGQTFELRGMHPKKNLSMDQKSAAGSQ